jgi:hypothetical protein
MRLTTLVFCLLLAACASQPAATPGPEAAPAAAPLPPPEKEDTATQPKEGMTLKDVADELEWRKKTADELESSSY